MHTPEGVRDIYNRECARKLALQDRLRGLLGRYGYHPVETPTFEFFDIFSKEIGTTPSKDLYKFFDREGNTLALRPDMTPQIARCAAKYYGDEVFPVRLCYVGNTFVNNSSYQGRLKEITQLGAELMGDGSVDADAEIVALVAHALLESGLSEFQIGVGHVGFFKGLVNAAKLDEEDEGRLVDLISNKNFFGVEELLDSLRLPGEIRELFSMMGSICMTEEMMCRAKELAKGYREVQSALERLGRLMQVLPDYGVEKYVTVEPGMLGGRHYYTGIVFAGYTFGSGEPVVRGGRYDGLLSHFGKDSPAIGFAVSIDRLLAALSRQKAEAPADSDEILLAYDEASRARAIRQAVSLREEGRRVSLARWESGRGEDEYRAYAERMGMGEVLFLTEE